jgi:glycerol 3-phosphatase-2
MERARRQALLEQALKDSPRQVLVGNPDLVAPVENGCRANRAIMPIASPMPPASSRCFSASRFPAIFDMARERIRPGVPDERVLMVGDTLHTDILGGNAAGFRTALIAGYGFFDGEDPAAAIAESGIVPDFILDRP